MSEDTEKKVLIEQNGKTSEISKEKLQEMQSNPDYQVEKMEDDNEKYKVKERLHG